MLKKAVSRVLIAVLCSLTIASCTSSPADTDMSKTGEQSSRTEQSSADGNDEKSDTKPASENTHTISVRDSGKSEKMTATFWNSTTGGKTDVEMTRTSEADGYYIYSCDGLTDKYNMVHFAYGSDTPTMDVAFSSFVSGWYLDGGELLPYVVGKEPNYQPAYETAVFNFMDYDKNVYIWTPDDYDKNSAEKYSVIYMFDGQTVLSPEMTSDQQTWNVAEHVESMMAETDYKAIIVAIETLGGESKDKTVYSRADELIPDIGDLAEWVDLSTKKLGNKFSDFVYDTVVPYVEKNYNVYTDREHNSICGSSLGGLASFNTAIRHPDKFGTTGVLSATFQIYDDESLIENYDPSVLSGELPFMYFYAGSYNDDNAEALAGVYNYLIKAGYPADKLVFNKDEDGKHFVPYWRNIYPEFLEAMFTQKVSALKSGEPIGYNDRSYEKVPEVSNDRSDTRSAEMLSYIYFDNSSTKWDKVYAYWWGDDYNSKNKATEEEKYGKAWPGLEMEKIGDTDIYRIAFPVGPTGLVFSTGVTEAEVLNGTTAYQTEDLKLYEANAGQVYKIDVSDPPVPGKGKQKTKFKYQTGTWSDYYG